MGGRTYRASFMYKSHAKKRIVLLQADVRLQLTRWDIESIMSKGWNKR
jgi:hypothetical protein